VDLEAAALVDPGAPSRRPERSKSRRARPREAMAGRRPLAACTTRERGRRKRANRAKHAKRARCGDLGTCEARGTCDEK
jgi:hypothetical protein